jgi:hypothetical protein
MLTFVVQHQPHRPGADFRGKFVRRLRFHGSTFSRVGASDNPGAVQSESQRADLDAFTAQVTTKRTARAWLYREQLREILDRKQINVVSAMLKRWCTNVKRSKVEPMKQVAKMIRTHFDGVIAWDRVPRRGVAGVGSRRCSAGPERISPPLLAG